MKRISLYFLLTSIVTLTLVSCNPCNNLDCISSNYFGQFRIISKIDGRDLVFGPNAIYDKTKVKFYSLSGSDTSFFDFSTIKFSGSDDSILYVKFYPETITPAYMKLSDTQTDTLAITYHSFKTKCCGTITEIEKFRINNSTDIPGHQGTQEIKK